MKPRKLSRRQLAGLPPGPLFRDIAPDRTAVYLYGEEGEPVVTCDVPTSMMNSVRHLARRERVCVHSLIVAILRDAVDKAQRGF